MEITNLLFYPHTIDFIFFFFFVIQITVWFKCSLRNFAFSFNNQEAVFSQTKPIATSVKDGFNVCIFAYGQTGTSKTFTMEGTPEERGVNYRTLEELFRTSEERKGVMKYDLHVSMLEVYNEKIRDLLVENSTQPTKKLDNESVRNVHYFSLQAYVKSDYSPSILHFD
ncbi:unnamed protein product [Trifolium pratense]|uniref:Uncharacterized protein n=1 Tax=Trifolium pratense TaxID=57577 RepID=A0ACB0JIC0_TRIPR|nr:unnamed protein product [Trifolium pratense]